ncbi:MAG TPA: deoxyribodipyrimidine photo-lyase [Woeseiaceae bacterium]|nr:deoxyribodipyrimidine photo-lyase [Woeseiaceae bacterium]
MSNSKPVILWFRQDLRLADNPALLAAVASDAPLLPVYILDEVNAGVWAPGAAGKWWLYESLTALNKSLGDALRFFRGNAGTIIPHLVAETRAQAVYWNRCYEPWRRSRDEAIRSELAARGCTLRSFNGSLLFEPMNVTKTDRTPYKVFTPFYRNGCLGNGPEPRVPLEAPASFKTFEYPAQTPLTDLGLLPDVPWYEEMQCSWTPGEQGASERLRAFLERGLSNYREGRNFPARQNVSRLSPHLHYGEVSPQQVWHAINTLHHSTAPAEDIEHFRRELVWREFSNNLLYHFPELPDENLQRKFDRFPWRDDPVALRLWQRGETGYPIVDAGMRELWRTGYMHNRVRMITGSFLVKNLLLHWHQGERWFWDTLVDADLANNSASWQWIAGCGADAAPYFRIFNPVTQGRKFDPDGTYVRRYVPELALLPEKYVHAPWEAPPQVLQECGVVPGETYPAPVVDLQESRERALAAFRSLTARRATP